MMNSVEHFLRIRGNACEHCHKPFMRDNWPERHHSIKGRSKHRPEFDEDVNIELVCHNCHQSGEVDSFEHRQEFAMRQVNRGYNVSLWIQSLDLKAPEQWLLEL